MWGLRSVFEAVNWKNYFRKSTIDFPDPHYADEDGLLAIGGKLDIPTLVTAYYHGIFPWPQDGLPMLWFSPGHRGILEFKDLHLPKSLQKEIRKPKYSYSMNTAFEKVIAECAKQMRPGQQGTWILPVMKKQYLEFHRSGFAHSFEVWEEGDLIGGLYGVEVAGVFSGESMFFKKPNASKLALVHAVECLRKKGMSWIDIQMVTPVLESMGGKYIDRSDYLEKIEKQRSE
ncbi:MAG: leucyl/phenylalanyl-tRNA--protein transferase [Pseudobdellovibrionaceae bacterium]